MNPFHFTEVGAMVAHQHIHETGIQRPHPLRPKSPETDIYIQKVVSGIRVDWHLVYGELLANPLLAQCNSPYGHVTVQLSTGKMLYACLKASRTHELARSEEHNDGDHESYYCYIGTLEGHNMSANLTPGNKKRLESQLSTGHVHYKVQGKIDVQGDLYISHE